MYILIGIIFIAIGVVMLVRPETVFQITESWKSSTNNEPSNLYIASTRIGGIAFLIIGAASIIASLLYLV